MFISPIELHVLKVYIRAFIDCLTSNDYKELAFVSERARNDEDLGKISRDILATLVASFEHVKE